MSRTDSGALAAPQAAPTWWGRAALVMAATFALVLGVVPGLSTPTADAGTARLGNFQTTVTVNQGQSNLRPGGHVRYDIRAFNTQDRDTVIRLPIVGEQRTPNYSLLAVYGIDAPAGLSYRDAGGSLYAAGGWGKGGNFVGGTPANIGIDSLDDISNLRIRDLPNIGVRGQDSRSGWISFDIPADAQGGQTYTAGVRAIVGFTTSFTSAAGVESFTLGAVSSQTQVTVPPTVARVGEPVELSATVAAAAGSNTPAGTMAFAADGQSETVPVVNGVANTTMTFDTTGNKPVTVTFTPTNTNQWQGSSGTGTVQVEAEATQTNLELDSVQIISGDTISATANVTPAEADGEVQFTVGEQSQTVPVTAGSANAEFTLDVPENATVTATFLPSNPARYTSSTDTETVTVSSEQTETTVEVSPEIARVGEDSTLQANVTPADAAGTVAFAVEGETYTVEVVDGVATAVHQFGATGEIPVTAEFTPADTNRYSSSTGQATANVQSETTETNLELDAVEILSGDTISATARVTPADAEGHVEFDFDGQTETIPLVKGVATAEFTLDALGDATITATFIPANSERYTTSSDTETVSVSTESTQLTISAGDNIVLDEPTTITATVAPTDADGTVTFTVDGQEYVVNVVDGVAVAEHTFTEYGEYPVTAVFAPTNTDRYSASEAETTIVIEPVTGSVDLGSLEIGGGSAEWFAALDLGSLNALAGSAAQLPN